MQDHGLTDKKVASTVVVVKQKDRVKQMKENDGELHIYIYTSQNKHLSIISSAKQKL